MKQQTYKPIAFFNIWIVAILLFCLGCEEKENNPKDPDIQSFTAFYISCEGLINNNNGTLAYYNIESQQLEKDYFAMKNGRGLGDTPNDLQIYGAKMYCVLSFSNVVEVIDSKTGISLKQIAMRDEKGVGRQPRYLSFYKGKTYVCNFDGTVARIDTSSLEIEAFVQCRKNPDGICATNGKLYVSNSGGLDFPTYDSTVSVINLAEFKEIKKITVEKNPYKIHADTEGDVYVISRGDYGSSPYVFQRIDSKKDTLAEVFQEINALNFTISDDMAYLYNYDFGNGNSWIKLFNCKTEQIVKENFITDGTVVNTPYGLSVDSENGDVYITDAYNFMIQGDVYCFDKNGIQKFKLSNVGLNPNGVVKAPKP